MRGQVMPEVDMPGHLTAWGRALPHQNLTIDTGTRHGELDYGIANFASPHLLPTVLKVVKEMAELFVDELFFFGGDETACAYNECDYRDYDNQTERCPHMATERNNFTCEFVV
jgi:N-acetyl-beta-hexosaminidase